MESKSFSRVAAILSAVLVVALVVALPAGSAAKKKKKKCPAGTVKQVVKKKGKKKVRCVPVAATPTPAPTPAPMATLSISPTAFDFGGLNQQDPANCNPPPDPDCPTQVFTVTNAGPNASGAPSTSIVILATDPMEPPAFSVFANTCTAPLAPGGACTVTARAHTPDNFNYVSRLDVSASPGGTASATLMAQ